MLKKAAEFAERAHRGMVRKGSDIPYITHPLEAAVIVSGMTDDEELIAAALLHERARGARLRAVAARLAGARAPVRPERGLDGRARPALARAQRVVARGGVAGAHAALAADAQVRVVAPKRVAVQHGLLRARRRVRRALHAILAAEVGQLAGPILVA